MKQIYYIYCMLLYSIIIYPQSINRIAYNYSFNSVGNTIFFVPSIAFLNDNNEKITFEYNINGKLISKLHEKNGSNFEKTSYSYDTYGNNSVTVLEKWNNSSNSWSNIRKETFGFNSQHLKTNTLIEMWSNGNWVNSGQVNYTYNSQGLNTSVLSQSWFNSNWVNSWRKTNTYNSFGNITSEQTQTWQSAWINSSRATYNYDSNKLILSLVELWNNGNWKNNIKRQYFYTSNEFLDYIVSEIFENGSWKNRSKANYSYDSAYNIILILYERWTDSWINDSKTLYNYDENNNCIYGENHFWAINTWVPITSSLNLSYNNNSSSLSLTAQNISVQYSVVSSLEDEINVKKIILSNNYPNPFNPSTTIKYSIVEESRVKINVYNLLGELVTELVNTEQQAGYYETKFNANNLPSGVYFYSIFAEPINGGNVYRNVKKMLLVK